MKLMFAALLAATTCCAQTATIPQQTVTTTAPTIPAGTTLCNVQRNGACRTTTAIALPKLAVTVPVQTVPVNLSGFSANFSCVLGPNSTIVTNPDGTKSVTGLVCSITKP